MKGIYKISIYIIIPSPLSFLDLDPNTALRRQADLWGLGSKMLEMRGRYDVAYYSPYLSFLWMDSFADIVLPGIASLEGRVLQGIDRLADGKLPGIESLANFEL